MPTLITQLTLSGVKCSVWLPSVIPVHSRLLRLRCPDVFDRASTPEGGSCSDVPVGGATQICERWILEKKGRVLRLPIRLPQLVERELEEINVQRSSSDPWNW